MAHEDGVCGPERTIPEQTRYAVAEMEFASCDACLDWQEIRHAMPALMGILEAAAQHHVAAALAVNSPGFSETPQPVKETPGIRETLRMKFGVAAG